MKLMISWFVIYLLYLFHFIKTLHPQNHLFLEFPSVSDLFLIFSLLLISPLYLFNKIIQVVGVEFVFNVGFIF